MHKDSSSSPIPYQLYDLTLFSAWYPHLLKKEYAKTNDLWYIKHKAQSWYMSKQTFNQRELLFESGVCKLLWRKNYFMLYRSLSFCCNNSTLLLQSESSHRQMSEWACPYYQKTTTTTTKKPNSIYKSKVKSILLLQAIYCSDPWFVWCKVRIKILY